MELAWSFMEPTANNPPVDRMKAVSAREDFSTELLRDVRKLASFPSILSNRLAIPALAGLALALERDSTTCKKAVVATLHKALGRVTGFEDKLSGQEVSNALAELLGIGHGKWKNQPDRFDNAAEELSTYTSGQSFRKTRRETEPGKFTNVWEIFLELLVAELVGLANEIGLVSAGRHIHNVQSGIPRMTVTDRVDTWAATGYIHHYELFQLYFRGLDPFRRISNTGRLPDILPTLITLSATVYPSGGTELEKLEALLSWAISSYHETTATNGGNRGSIQALYECFEIGRDRGLSLSMRMDRALPYFDFMQGDVMGDTLEGLAEALCQLALDEDARFSLALGLVNPNGLPSSQLDDIVGR
jgi:hypothetical protein